MEENNNQFNNQENRQTNENAPIVNGVNFNNNPYGNGTFTSPTATAPNSRPYSDKRTGYYVTALVMTIISVCVMAFSFYFIAATLEGAVEDFSSFIAFIFILGPIGFFIFIGSLCCVVVALVFSILSIGSSKKFFKASGIILTIISVFLCLAYVGLVFYALLTILNAK